MIRGITNRGKIYVDVDASTRLMDENVIIRKMEMLMTCKPPSPTRLCVAGYLFYRRTEMLRKHGGTLIPGKLESRFLQK